MDNSEYRPAISPRPVTRHVYIVDDDKDVRDSLSFLLSLEKIKAKTFYCAEDFFEQLTELVPGPILIDVRMPSVDGLTMLSILRETNIHWPVVMMTGHADVDVAARAIELGALGMLAKPFESQLLAELIEPAFQALEL